MLLIYGDENALNEDEREACYVESAGLTQELHAAGKYLGAAPLHPTATAKSVRVREGTRFVTDGPFAETHEQLGGFFLVEARDADEALGIAERIPAARWGTVEVRPVIEISGMPES
ncbi:MAG TPA: YciI family protein [Fimbriimonadaceae bacterium]|nr:YciI family protein [Fimbriimonadaceae bacterium]